MRPLRTLSYIDFSADPSIGCRRPRDPGALPWDEARMPRFFGVSDGRCAADTQGVESVDDRAARREAVRRAAMLPRATQGEAEAVGQWRIAVEDERGVILFRIGSAQGPPPASS